MLQMHLFYVSQLMNLTLIGLHRYSDIHGRLSYSFRRKQYYFMKSFMK